MSVDHQPIVFDNPLDWGPPEAFVEADTARDGRWAVQRGVWGASQGLMISNTADHAVPELRIEPACSGWHDVAVRVRHAHPHARGLYGGHDLAGTIHVGTTKDRGLRALRAEIRTEEFEVLSLGPRDLTGAAIRIDGAYHDCCIDAVQLTPCEPPAAWSAPEKELCGILDFADAPDDYRPLETGAAECVRAHAEAGFTTLFWKAYAVRAEFWSQVAPQRRPQDQPQQRVTVGHLLERYDTLAAAVDEARSVGMKLLGWMRINNEMQPPATGGTEWNKFTELPPFHQQHPQLRERDKEGRLGPRLSFAFPEVRRYLCAIAGEIMDRGVDGLMIDVLRHPPMVRFDQPLVEAFLAKTGDDPRRMDGDGTEEWLRFRATAFTDLLRDLRQTMNQGGHAEKPIYVRAMPQPWRLLRDGCDVDAWLREGLVDTFVAGHHCILSPGLPARLDLAPIQQLLRDRARLVAQVFRFSDLHSALALGKQAYDQGADGAAIYESNQLVTLPSYRASIQRLRQAHQAP